MDFVAIILKRFVKTNEVAIVPGASVEPRRDHELISFKVDGVSLSVTEVSKIKSSYVDLADIMDIRIYNIALMHHRKPDWVVSRARRRGKKGIIAVCKVRTKVTVPIGVGFLESRVSFLIGVLSYNEENYYDPMTIPLTLYNHISSYMYTSLARSLTRSNKFRATLGHIFKEFKRFKAHVILRDKVQNKTIFARTQLYICPICGAKLLGLGMLLTHISNCSCLPKLPLRVDDIPKTLAKPMGDYSEVYVGRLLRELKFSIKEHARAISIEDKLATIKLDFSVPEELEREIEEEIEEEEGEEEEEEEYDYQKEFWF